MWCKIEMFRYIFVLVMLHVLVVCGSSCRDSKTHGSYFYSLSRGGYSPDTNRLLFAVHFDLGEPLKGTSLAIYDEEKRLAKRLFPIRPAPFDFAWAPEQSIFVVTHDNRMTLYQEDASDCGYSGTAIRCPVNFIYTFCSWNPKGEYLAVNCFDLEKASGNRLGLYDLKKETCVITNMVMDTRPPVWQNDATVYVTNDDNLLEVKVESGSPKLIRTIILEEGVTFFYGMFDDQALVQKEKEIKLGNRTLVELDQVGRKFRVITTETTIFVSASSKNLVAFDHEGREIDRINPERTIRFGSIGKDPNTVYGLAGSMLLRIYVENASLNIQEVCDLANLK